MTQREMEHERNRFSYMTEAQLESRLKRITKPNKLLNFITVARESGLWFIADRAVIKFQQLTGFAPIKGVTDTDNQRSPQPRYTGVTRRSVTGEVTRRSISSALADDLNDLRAATKKKKEIVKEEKPKFPKGVRVIR